VPAGDLTQRVDEVARALEVRRQEQRVPPAHVGRDPVRVVPAAEQPLRERAVGDHEPAGRPRPRQQLALRRADGQAVAHLVREHRAAERCLGRAPLAQRAVAHADALDGPVPARVGEAAHGDAHRHDRVRRVELVEVEPLDAEPARARARAPAHHARHRQYGIQLRGEERLVAPAGDRGADDPLRAAEPVDLGGVDHVDAQVERPPHDGGRLAPGVALAVAPLSGAELPRAEPDHRQARPGHLGVAHRRTLPAAPAAPARAAG
jgi:hypothetical protein